MHDVFMNDQRTNMEVRFGKGWANVGAADDTAVRRLLDRPSGTFSCILVAPGH